MYNYFQIDFTSERIIEGIVTKGNSIPILKGNAWIEAFKIRYSLDGVNWSPVLNEDKTEKVFKYKRLNFYCDLFNNY